MNTTKDYTRASTLLVRAKAHIELFGWVRHDLAIAVGCIPVSPEHHLADAYCALGALRASTHEGDERAFEIALGSLRRAIGNPSVTIWNDAPGRTKGDVLDAFSLSSDLLQAQIRTALGIDRDCVKKSTESLDSSRESMSDCLT